MKPVKFTVKFVSSLLELGLLLLYNQLTLAACVFDALFIQAQHFSSYLELLLPDGPRDLLCSCEHWGRSARAFKGSYCFTSHNAWGLSDEGCGLRLKWLQPFLPFFAVKFNFFSRFLFCLTHHLFILPLDVFFVFLVCLPFLFLLANVELVDFDFFLQRFLLFLFSVKFRGERFFQFVSVD